MTNTRTRRTHNHTQKNQPHKSKVTLGLLYANWCGHCQALKPEWKHLKGKINKDRQMREQCKIVEIESNEPRKDKKIAMVNKHISGENKLVEDGYPTIFLVNHGKLEKYVGGRTSDEMHKWVGGAINESHVQEQPIVPNLFAGGKKSKTIKHRQTKKCNSWFKWFKN